MGIDNFNKNSNETIVKGSNKITKKIPINKNVDQILKYLSSLVCLGLDLLAIAKTTNKGVNTPTMYNGDKKGEMFFKK